VATDGNDANPGTLDKPWKTIQKAVNYAVAGDTIFVRGGQYPGIDHGWIFQHSGTQSKPITLTNYPGEQVLLLITTAATDHEIFRCTRTVPASPGWDTPQADYIHIIGTDVEPSLLSNGVSSKKGIVIQGLFGELSSGVNGSGCDYWEIAGIDFIQTGFAIYAHNWGASPDYWYVHDNRVYNFYKESGMQFNGSHNIIENNEIYKISNDYFSSFGCQMLNLLGHENVVRGNTISRGGSTYNCLGILFEWDLADNSIIEQNKITDVPTGVEFEGGDNNIIRNNIIVATPGTTTDGIKVLSYDNQTTYPCDDPPITDPTNPDYPYLSRPYNCHSQGNQIYNNVINGFKVGIDFYPVVGENTIIRNNAILGWTKGGICNNTPDGSCDPVAGVTADHNMISGDFGFVDLLKNNFHLTATSPLINSGYDLGSLNPNDFDGNLRPQGGGYDIGAYEFSSP
jgi:hypothetical protein